MTVYGTVFVSDAAYDESYSDHSDGYKAAKVVKNQIEYAIDDAGATPDVTISSDTSFDPDDYNDDTLGEAWWDFWKDWLPNHSDESDDFNLMLLTAAEVSGDTGGATGSSTPHPAACARGAEYLDDDDLDAERYGLESSNTESYVRTCLHEVGHNLGMSHWQGNKHYVGATSYIADTPMYCGSGTNNCGHNCESGSTSYVDNLYASCAISNADEL